LQPRKNLATLFPNQKAAVWSLPDRQSCKLQTKTV
jgi:hypothetical protein